MIVFQDIDGCLNTEDGESLDLKDAVLSPQQEFALKGYGAQLDNSPVTSLVINTGRSWSATKFICDAIGSTKLRYALTEHGAELWDYPNDVALDLIQISDELGLEEIRTAFESVHSVHKLMTWFHATGNSLVCAKIGYPEVMLCMHEKTSNLTIHIPDDVEGDELMSSLKAAIANDDSFSGDNFVFHHNRADGFIDVMGLIDKGMGVEVVTRYLNGNFAETFAIGDGLNDLPMLHAVNYPICPGNAVLEVQELCSAKGHRSSANYIAAVTNWLSQVDSP